MIRRALMTLGVVLCLGAAVMAQETFNPFEEAGTRHHANETGNPAMFNYMITDFFNQRYATGPGPIWRSCILLYAVDFVLAADLWRRRGWAR